MRHWLPAVFCTLATLIVCSAPAVAQGLPGATVRPDSSAGASTARPADRDAKKSRLQQRCQENPQQCEEAKAKIQERREQCQADLEKCRAEARARFEQRFKKADADGSGAVSRAEAEKSMPVVARHFDEIDANHDGQVTMDEIQTAQQARAAQRKGGAPK